ncbi:MAG: PIN domain-containing protein [Candidatus Daviesbacteria bacterium]|nr:PIN domain-containing protein [Candidatus Daviesbacteria bacterium]
MKVFIDTNIFIRFFTHDLEEKVPECERLIELIQDGKVKPCISNIVILELIFVLTRQYKFKKESVLKALKKLLSLRNIMVVEVTKTEGALQLFMKHNIKYTDCLIATQIPKGVTLVTYDSDFSKIPALKPITPAEIFNSDTVN